jgi:DNA-binding transcriptional ArsR family regulator
LTGQRICVILFSDLADTQEDDVEHALNDLSRFYRALGDQTRLHLVALLAQQEPGSAFCVTRLARELGVTPSAVSQHLRVLKDLGLVRGERRSYRIHYFLDPERLAAYQGLARELLGEAFVVGNKPLAERR